jgi:molybdopterin-synthase adenylyltransferase
MFHRYSRQTLFAPIGKTGQEKLSNKHVLLIGCGALGCANAESLTRAGVGTLTIVDRDYVELSNLQRQQLFTEQDAHEQLPKTIAAKNKLQQINSSINIHAHVLDVTSVSILPFLKNVDLVIDATDNLETRLMLNDLLHQQNIPWIFGSCAGSTGMSFTIIPNETPCLHCLLQAVNSNGATCDSAGIIYPAVQIVAAMQITEALKILIDDFQSLRTKLFLFDLWNNQFQQWSVTRAKSSDCPTCGKEPSYPYLAKDNTNKIDVLCGRDTVLIRGEKPNSLSILAEKLKSIGPMKRNEFILSIEYESYRIVFFTDGRTLIHGTNSIDKAKSIYFQLVG